MFQYLFAAFVVLSLIVIVFAYKEKSLLLALFGALLSVPLSLYLAAQPITYYLPVMFPLLVALGGKALFEEKRKAALLLMAPYFLSASCVVLFGYVLTAFIVRRT